MKKYSVTSVQEKNVSIRMWKEPNLLFIQPTFAHVMPGVIIYISHTGKIIDSHSWIRASSELRAKLQANALNRFPADNNILNSKMRNEYEPLFEYYY